MQGELIHIVQGNAFIENGHVSYKNNYRSEGIRIANARTKVIIFCKSHPLNCN